MRSGAAGLPSAMPDAATRLPGNLPGDDRIELPGDLLCRAPQEPAAASARMLQPLVELLLGGVRGVSDDDVGMAALLDVDAVAQTDVRVGVDVRVTDGHVALGL